MKFSRNMNISCLLFFTLFFLFLFNTGCKRTSTDNNRKNKDSVDVRIEELTEKINARPEVTDNYLRRARLYEKKGHLDLAIKDMTKLLSMDSSRYQDYDYLGDLVFKGNSVRSAIFCYNKSVRLKPDNEYAYIRLGEIYLYMADRKQSLQNLGKALKINRYNPKTLFLIAYDYLENKDTAKAILNFQASVDADADYYDSHMNLGLIYAKRRNNLAATYYNHALRIKPNSIETLYDLGKYYQDIDSFNTAIHYYQQILSQIEDHKSTNYNLGYIYYRLGNYDKSVQFFSTAISKMPLYKEAYYGRALSYMKMKNTAMARKDLQKVLDMDPNDLPAQKELRNLPSR